VVAPAAAADAETEPEKSRLLDRRYARLDGLQDRGRCRDEMGRAQDRRL